jgi:hypothetical protein
MHEFRQQRSRAHLAHHPPSMGLHGDFADTELTADLLVHLPSNHQRHHFPFATANRLVAITECLQPRHRGRHGANFSGVNSSPPSCQRRTARAIEPVGDRQFEIEFLDSGVEA